MPSFKLSIQFPTNQHKVELLLEPILQMNKQCLAFHIEAIAVGFYYSLLELAGQQLQRYQIYLSIPEPISYLLPPRLVVIFAALRASST